MSTLVNGSLFSLFLEFHYVPLLYIFTLWTEKSATDRVHTDSIAICHNLIGEKQTCSISYLRHHDGTFNFLVICNCWLCTSNALLYPSL